MDDKQAQAWKVFVPHSGEVIGYRSSFSEARELRNAHNRSVDDEMFTAIVRQQDSGPTLEEVCYRSVCHAAALTLEGLGLNEIVHPSQQEHPQELKAALRRLVEELKAR